MSINKVIIIGNVGKDPEVSFAGQVKIVNLSVATTERYKDKSGEKQERTEWHKIAFFGKAADFVEDYVKKGSKVFIEGKIHYSSKDDRYYTTINAERVELVGSKKKDNINEDEDMPFL